MSHPVDTHVGTKLKQARLLKKMALTEVAEELGLSFQQVQKYETGATRIAASRLFELAGILGVPMTYFFDGFQDDTDHQPEMEAQSSRQSERDETGRRDTKEYTVN